ncbi:hypothetical protein ACFL2O_09930, partial [Thermodesulfobacteriota bacterium]
PLEGIAVSLYTQSGTYLGKNETTDASGCAGFNVPEGTYKVRADYMGYQYWSADTVVAADVAIDLTIPHQYVEITVSSVFQGAATALEGVPVYLYTAAGSYMGISLSTDSSGKVTFNLPQKAYKARADYMTQQYWTLDFTWADSAVDIPMADGEVTVTGAGFPRDGVPVHVFTGAGVYLGINSPTDTQGQVTFRLPEGSYNFRADYMSSQYWSGETSLARDLVNPVNITTGGGTFTLTVQKGAGNPLTGVMCYVFNEAGAYLGLLGSTDANGETSFDLTDGAYKFRVNYLGNQFWSDVVSVPASMDVTRTIAHQDVSITVSGVAGSDTQARENVRVYLFSEADAYMGLYKTTDAGGQAVFNLPQENYKVRADYMTQQFWSGIFNWTDSTVTIPEGEARVHVTMAGSDLEGAPVYLFTAGDSYLGLNKTTDASGLVTFRVPAGSYKFRADHQSNQYWGSGDVLQDVINDVSIDTGGGTFTFTVDTGQGPLEGAGVYVFNQNDAYLGMTSPTNAGGEAAFGLADGSFKFRVDHMGYQFWSGVYNVPSDFSGALTITHQDAVVTVEGHYQTTDPLEGLNVYLFTSSGSYMGEQRVTDASGQASFFIPQENYKIRADYLGQQFWSADFNGASIGITIEQGLARVHVHDSGTDVEGARVYLYSEADAYLGINVDTDASGNAEFTLPDRPYKFRIDVSGQQHWTPLYNITAGQVNDVDMDIGQ